MTPSTFNQFLQTRSRNPSCVFFLFTHIKSVDLPDFRRELLFSKLVHMFLGHPGQYFYDYHYTSSVNNFDRQWHTDTEGFITYDRVIT